MNYLVAVDNCFVDRPGGSARVAWDIAMLMCERAHKVTLFCMEPVGCSTGTLPEEADGVRIVRYRHPALPNWYPGRARCAIRAAAEVARQRLRDTKWDVVHVHTPFTGQGAMDGIGPGPRYLYTMHSPITLEQRINWGEQGWTGRLKLALGLRRLQRLEKGLLQKCDGIQTLSEYTRREMNQLHGLGGRVRIIPHWRRPELKRMHQKAEARRLLGWPTDQPILFTLRRHGSRYGIDVAIRALAPLAKAGRCRFMIGGDGAMRPALERLTKELGAESQIRFLGRIPDEQVGLAYEAADLFVLPTLALECFGLIISEAFAYGCPVVSSDAGAIPELMRPIMPDFVVRAGDAEGLRAKVAAFLDGKLRPPSGEELTNYVERRFAKQVIVPQMLAWIEGQREDSPCDLSPQRC